MIAKDFVPIPGIRSFAIMKYLVRHCSWKSHPSPRPHSPRIPDAFTAGNHAGFSGAPLEPGRCPRELTLEQLGRALAPAGRKVRRGGIGKDLFLSALDRVED